MSAGQMLNREFGSLLLDIWVSDSHREARGHIKCNCGKNAVVSACSDVGGIWIFCDHCGRFEDV